MACQLDQYQDKADEDHGGCDKETHQVEGIVLPFAAGQAFVDDGGLAEIALGQVHLPLAGIRQVGGKCGADERAEQEQACLHVYPPFDFAIMARRAMECKGRSRPSRNVYLRLRVRYWAARKVERGTPPRRRVLCGWQSLHQARTGGAAQDRTARDRFTGKVMRRK